VESLPRVEILGTEKQKSLELAASILNVEERASHAAVNPNKFRRDFALGKMAEFGAARYLSKHHGLPLLVPDLGIRTNEDRASIQFDVDLAYSNFNVHVKSIKRSTVCTYEESYNMQWGDPLLTEPTGKDWILLCVVDDAGRWIDVRGLVRARYVLSEGLWQQPRLAEKKSWKHFLYWENLNNSITKLS